MKRLALVCFVVLCSTSVFAQNQRTWVSNSGVDSGTSCSLAAPCRTLSYALAVTNAAGDIVVLNSGGYGSSLVINKAVNIFAPDGVYAVLTNLTPSSSVIYINAGANDIVRLKGINVLSTDSTTGTGLNVGVCKRAEISNMQISRIGYGVYIGVDTRVYLKNLTITDTTTGIWSIGSNTASQPYPNQNAGPFLRVVVEGTTISGTGTGVKLDAGSFQMVQNDVIAFATVDSYIIQAGVASCSAISLNYNSDSNVYYNNLTGVPNPNCPQCGNVQDLRNGNTTIGSCTY